MSHVLSVHRRDPCLRTQTFTVSSYFSCYFCCYQIANISLTVLLYLCFILSILRRLDYSAAIQELLSFLGIETKHYLQPKIVYHESESFEESKGTHHVDKRIQKDGTANQYFLLPDKGIHKFESSSNCVSLNLSLLSKR